MAATSAAALASPEHSHGHDERRSPTAPAPEQPNPSRMHPRLCSSRHFSQLAGLGLSQDHVSDNEAASEQARWQLTSYIIVIGDIYELL